MNIALPLTHSGFIVGWRGWFQYDGYGPHKALEGSLYSICVGYVWPALKPAQGDCSSRLHPKGGIYAFKTFSLMQELLEKDKEFDWGYSLVGSVALWGTIVEHENGFRATYAYPLAVAQAPLRHSRVWKAENLGLVAARYGFEGCDYDDLQSATLRITKEIKTCTSDSI